MVFRNDVMCRWWNSKIGLGCGLLIPLRLYYLLVGNRKINNFLVKFLGVGNGIPFPVTTLYSQPEDSPLHDGILDYL